MRDQTSDVADVMRGIAWQEMFHLGLAGNMLAAIGGKPQIKAPQYPGSLPRGVNRS